MCAITIEMVEKILNLRIIVLIRVAGKSEDDKSGVVIDVLLMRIVLF